jgi:hypothetical protein
MFPMVSMALPGGATHANTATASAPTASVNTTRAADRSRLRGRVAAGRLVSSPVIWLGMFSDPR